MKILLLQKDRKESKRLRVVSLSGKRQEYHLENNREGKKIKPLILCFCYSIGI